MCGIVGYIGKEKRALNVLINGLEYLEYRGYDSAGIAYIYNDDLIIKKEVGKIANLKKIVNFNNESNIGIGHTRWATHGVANKINSHPHRHGLITLVHNGIIENYLELKKELLLKKYNFKSDTDTEVAAVLIYDLYLKTNDMIRTIKLFKEKVKGTYAILLICDKEPDNLYVIKKGSPLIIGIGNDANYVSSDILAIMEYTNKYIVLNDYEYAKINKDKIWLYGKNDSEILPDIKEIKLSNEVINKNGYDHYMLKEIHEEPNIIKQDIDFKEIPDIRKYKQIIIVGCGSAMHAGYIGKYLIETYGNIPVSVEIASEFRYKKLFLNNDSLVIAISQSGETADTLEAIKIANSNNVDTLGIVNVRESSIAREVKQVVYTEAGREIAVATTKAYLAQIKVLILMAYKISNNKWQKEEEFNRLSYIAKNIIDNEEIYLNIAKKIHNKNDIFFIGRGIDYALCMEGSLKLKEISYIHSEAYPAGELKHGTISLIEEGSPVIGIVTDKTIASKTISNLKEVKARGAYVIYITHEELDINGDFYDEKIVIPSTEYLFLPLITIIPLQLIAYYIAKINNCDIDKPKNLAKSVTVE